MYKDRYAREKAMFNINLAQAGEKTEGKSLRIFTQDNENEVEKNKNQPKDCSETIYIKGPKWVWNVDEGKRVEINNAITKFVKSIDDKYSHTSIQTLPLEERLKRREEKAKKRADAPKRKGKEGEFDIHPKDKKDKKDKPKKEEEFDAFAWMKMAPSIKGWK